MNQNSFVFVSALVQNVLSNATKLSWTLQGFGMLRLALPGGCRLNIWDSRYRVADVSLMHTHPWHFDSLIVAGSLCNIRYVERPFGKPYSRGLIKPGPFGGKLEDAGTVKLDACAHETYWPGQTYSQKADEIHVSNPDDGTITINFRQRVGPDVANVFWAQGTQWVSAIPREATSDEVSDIISRVKTLGE